MQGEIGSLGLRFLRQSRSFVENKKLSMVISHNLAPKVFFFTEFQVNSYPSGLETGVIYQSKRSTSPVISELIPYKNVNFKNSVLKIILDNFL